MTRAPSGLASLRQEMRARRAALSPAHRIASAQQLADRLASVPGMPRSGYVAGYWAVDGEIALHAWQSSLGPDRTYCLPVLGTDQCLRFAPWRPGDAIVSNRFGIPEPDASRVPLLAAAELAAVVMPLVAFDEQCNRLGMGGGWYDRTLAPVRDAPVRPLLVGAGYEVQRASALEPAPWDVPVDAVCTESATYLRAPAP
ncbi:5-formyltetrahydrofolate cyclo-ligase [Cognatilysobacter lacus]|uniref:5-formyltetrahydrofolate cyclo-ligase n=1 Tax=Cognatilysobacter lacus TaxID=1643323 RepID=A0A5D8YPR7_9GAMM|nr:5-formyltetrahydrofolate cyclo-ligase [Lysobacter lacus]TZF84439.1 5-formyltetrahydrofolate cyclo-ligase [Lysobacter lacus]